MAIRIADATMKERLDEQQAVKRERGNDDESGEAGSSRHKRGRTDNGAGGVRCVMELRDDGTFSESYVNSEADARPSVVLD